MAKAKNTVVTKSHPKKTSTGQGRNTKFKSLGSGSSIPKGYKKKYRGQGKG